ncbi:MAG TPA: hypothetical protein VII69_11695 [Candidatus Eremiobacteraceae bacterium]
MTTLLHVYKTVSAQLFRTQERSTVAEEAWARATRDEDIHIGSSDLTFGSRLDGTRIRAIDLIRNANLPLALAERAICALDHAYYSAIEHVREMDTTLSA